MNRELKFALNLVAYVADTESPQPELAEKIRQAAKSARETVSEGCSDISADNLQKLLSEGLKDGTIDDGTKRSLQDVIGNFRALSLALTNAVTSIDSLHKIADELITPVTKMAAAINAFQPPEHQPDPHDAHVHAFMSYLSGLKMADPDFKVCGYILNKLGRLGSNGRLIDKLSVPLAPGPAQSRRVLVSTMKKKLADVGNVYDLAHGIIDYFGHKGSGKLFTLAKAVQETE